LAGKKALTVKAGAIRNSVKSSRTRHLWQAALPVLLPLIAFIALEAKKVHFNFQIPWLLPVLNTLFVFLIAVLVMVLFLRQVKHIGSWQILLMVNSLFVYGLATLVAGWAQFFGGQNITVTIHNLGCLMAAISLFIGTLVLLMNNSSSLRPQPGLRSWLVLTGSGLAVVLIALLAFLSLLPTFFLAGSSPTLLRQIVLILAALLFCISTVVVFLVYNRSKGNFLFWYATGLVLITLGLLVLPFYLEYGDPLNWLGRFYQYSGFLYLAIAILVLVRETRSKKTNVTFMLDEFLSRSSINYQRLVDSLSDAVILVDSWGRILSWNRAAEHIFGYTHSQAVGAFLNDLILSAGREDEFREDLPTLLELKNTPSGRKEIEMMAHRSSGQIFPCNVVVTDNRSGIESQALTFTLVIRDISEQQKNRDELAASETRFRLALSNAPVSVAAQDRDLKFLWAYNQRTVPPEVVIGKTDRDLFTPEDAEKLITIKKKVLESGKEIREQMWITSNHQRRYLDIFLEPIKDSRGQVNGVGVATLDLTQMKNAEELLMINNDRLKILSEAGSLLLTSDKPENNLGTIAKLIMAHLKCDCFFNFMADKQADKLYLNAYAGVSDKDAVRLEWLDYNSSLSGCVAKDGVRIISENVQNQTDVKLQMVKSLGLQAYACFPLPVGGVIAGTLSFGTSQKPLFTPEEVELMQAVAIMVANALERKAITDSLLESEEKFRSLAENSPDVIARFDEQGRYIYVNPGGLRPFDRDEKLLLGKTPAEIGPAAFIPLWEEKTREMLTTHKPVIIEHARIENNEEMFHQTILAPEMAADGSIKSFVSFTRDITELKKVEQLKDEFIGMVSHELKTPLTVIIGSLAVAKTSGIPAGQINELIQDAANYADDLVVIVDNLLELSRFQSKRLSIITEMTDLGDIAAIVAGKLGGRSAKHRIIVDIPRNQSLIPVDKVRIERVLYNLVENAIKYSPGGGEVRIFSIVRDGELVVGISDQGIGIAREDLPRLFQKFERIEAYEKHTIPGLGLGLRVCRILVEAHGGKIWVESDPKKGSTFYFSVPLGMTASDYSPHS
jgi:PAS domain S-box-containing protein